MSPKVLQAFAEIARALYGSGAPSTVIEIGAVAQHLLQIENFASSIRIAVSLSFEGVSLGSEIHRVIGNANSMHFKDGSLDCVLSCSVLEHDGHFWVSLNEIRRVLKQGGVFMVGVPVYARLPIDVFHTTVTYARHGYAYDADYYRFSEQAVREVIMCGFEVRHSRLVRRYPNPYVVTAGVKI